MNASATKYLRIALVLIVVSGAIGWATYAQTHRQAEVRYATVKLDRGRIAARVTATGTLSALVTVQVGSQVSGRMQEILVDYNSPVRKGQVLARIDPLLLEAAVEQGRANYAAAQGDLEAARIRAQDAERQYVRAKELRTQSLIAQADVDTAQTNSDAARAQVASANGRVALSKAALRQNEVNLAYATIASPIDGVVISRNVDVGQTVAASLQAPILFLIAQDLRKMQVDTSVAEGDVGHLQPGTSATFMVDAYPAERFTGVIRQVRDAPQTVQNVVTYDAVIDVDNSALKLKPGMTANVTFVYAERENALRVPNAALRFRPSASIVAKGAPASATRNLRRPLQSPDERTVWVLRTGKPVSVSLKIGVTDGTVTEMVGGDLHEGDEMITEMLGTPGNPAQGTQNPFRRAF
jgi:HlyD family secretion protein